MWQTIIRLVFTFILVAISGSLLQQDYIVFVFTVMRRRRDKWHLSSSESSLLQDQSFRLEMWLEHFADKIECILNLKWLFNQLKYSLFDQFKVEEVFDKAFHQTELTFHESGMLEGSLKTVGIG